MDSYCDSDEEIFFGPMTLKEVKKAAFLGRHTASNRSSFYSLKPDDEDSFKLLETRSEPDLTVEHTPERSRCLSFTENSSLEILKDDEMVINEITIDKIDDDIYSRFSEQVSDAVSELEPKPPLNREDTRFSEAPTCFSDQVSDKSFEDLERQLRTPKKQSRFHSVKSVIKDDSCDCDLNNTLERMEHILKCSDAKPRKRVAEKKKMFFDSPIPSLHRKRATPRTPTFKVPFKPVSRLLKPGFGTMEKSPSVSTFPGVVSPIGYYIQHSPSVPKIKNVRPGKPLRSFFNISQELNQSEHKENIALPAKAYQPAKTTELIDNTAPSGLPKNNQVKRMAEGIPTPQVIRHERRLCKTNVPLSSRNYNLSENQTKSEESFANLSMVKGDISVCVKKQAFRLQSSSKH